MDIPYSANHSLVCKHFNSSPFWYTLLCIFLRQGLTIYSWLNLNSLYCPGWFHNLPVFGLPGPEITPCLASFYILAIMNKAFMKAGKQISLQNPAFNSFGYRTQTRNSVLNDNFMINSFSMCYHYIILIPFYFWMDLKHYLMSVPRKPP